MSGFIWFYITKLQTQLVETKIKNLQARIEKIEQDARTSKSIDISQIGIDCLLVDEAHEFKNLFYSTSKGSIRGLGDPKGSDRAMDMYIKTQYLHENNHKIIFLTGTPVSNSIVELFTL